MTSRRSIPALLLCTVALAACPTGREVEPDRGPLPQPETSQWPDLLARPDHPLPIDLSRPLDRAPHDRVPPDRLAVQGKSCTGSGLTFVSDKPPAAGATLTLTVSGGTALVYVMGGVKAPSGAASWMGGAAVSTFDGGFHRWIFGGIVVPGASGPYSLCMLRDAVGDNPAKGTEAGCCVP